MENLGFFLNEIKGTEYEKIVNIQSTEDLNVNPKIDTTHVIPNIDISNVNFKVKEGATPFAHQLDFMKFAIHRYNKGNHNGFILTDEMGCVSGDAVISFKKGGASSKLSLRQFYNRYYGPNISDSVVSSLIEVRCLDEISKLFRHRTCENVIYSGIKSVIRLSLDDGKIVDLTPDHLVRITIEGDYKEAGELVVGDEVVINGEPVCRRCGSNEDMVVRTDAKFYGYCRRCMYTLREGTRHKHGGGIHRRIDYDGYVLLSGPELRDHPNYNYLCGVLEHHYVMSKHIGRGINTPYEVVHHKDRNKTNNDITNLELLTTDKHWLEHCNSVDYIGKGGLVVMRPKYAKIIAIEDAGSIDTYDIQMEAPHHNFIANGVVVHNCGKTVEVMNLALYRREHQNYKHCLVIVCINGAKYNWVEDIFLHTNGEELPYILGTRIKRDGRLNHDAGSKAKLEDLKSGYCYGKEDIKLPYFLVMNIEAIRMKSARKMPIMEEIIRLCRCGYINMIAIDEIHLNMSPTSLQGKTILKIKQQTSNLVEWLPMTGTPIINRPTDVFTPLKLVGGHEFSNYWVWNQHFVVYGGFQGHDILGYKNIPQLKTMLQTNMLRRLKRDVLDLPPKIYFTEYVENTSYQRRLYQDIQIELKQKKDEIINQMNPLVALLRLRQVNGAPELVDDKLVIDKDYLKKNAKILRILEILADIHERGEKVIIYSNWIEPLKTLYRFISKKYKVCCYTGTMKSSEREQHKQTFINNPEYTIMIGTIGALGTSHTLTVARNVIFFDECWTPAQKIQAEDRIHRPGTTHSVNIHTIITKDTIDEVVHNILADKKVMADYIVDGSLNLRHNSQLFDRLLM